MPGWFKALLPPLLPLCMRLKGVGAFCTAGDVIVLTVAARHAPLLLSSHVLRAGVLCTADDVWVVLLVCTHACSL